MIITIVINRIIESLILFCYIKNYYYYYCYYWSACIKNKSFSKPGCTFWETHPFFLYSWMTFTQFKSSNMYPISNWYSPQFNMIWPYLPLAWTMIKVHNKLLKFQLNLWSSSPNGHHHLIAMIFSQPLTKIKTIISSHPFD